MILKLPKINDVWSDWYGQFKITEINDDVFKGYEIRNGKELKGHPIIAATNDFFNWLIKDRGNFISEK